MSRAACATLLAAVVLMSLFGCGAAPDEGGGDPRADRSRLAEGQRQIEKLRAKIRRERKRQRETVDRSDNEVRASGGTADEGFADLERRLPGAIGLAMGPPGAPPSMVAGDLTSGAAWSTSKVPLALRVLVEAGGPDHLDPAAAEGIRRALTASDNAAAIDLFARLERRHSGAEGAAVAVTEVLREAGDERTVVSSEGRDGFTPFGQTEWSLADQVLFMSRLAAGCVGASDSAGYVLALMGEVTSDAWGLGAVGLPAIWKGGWGPGEDGRYLVRQMGVVTAGGSELVVALAAIPDDGTFETAQEMATEIGRYAATRVMQIGGGERGC